MSSTPRPSAPSSPLLSWHSYLSQDGRRRRDAGRPRAARRAERDLAPRPPPERRIVFDPPPAPQLLESSTRSTTRRRNPRHDRGASSARRSNHQRAQKRTPGTIADATASGGAGQVVTGSRRRGRSGRPARAPGYLGVPERYTCHFVRPAVGCRCGKRRPAALGRPHGSDRSALRRVARGRSRDRVGLHRRRAKRSRVVARERLLQPVRDSALSACAASAYPLQYWKTSRRLPGQPKLRTTRPGPGRGRLEIDLLVSSSRARYPWPAVERGFLSPRIWPPSLPPPIASTPSVAPVATSAS